jgi:hypothetical protein
MLDVTFAATADYAVALSIDNEFSAIALDAALIRNDDWTVAKSLKLIHPSVPIVLLDYRNVVRKNGLPRNIDAVARCNDPTDVLLTIKQLLD